MSEHREIVDQYVRDVLNGTIAASTFVQSAAQRYLRDIERVGDEDFPFYFCEKSADAICKWFPTHLKHSIGGSAKKKFYLMPFQQFIVWNLFGWRRNSDDMRRFRKAYISMGRKNGKSTLASGIALYMAGDDVNPIAKLPEPRAEVIVAACTREQADIIYKEVQAMIDQSPKLMIRTKERKSQIERKIEFVESGGYIKTVGSNRPKDGLNPHLVILDELHAYSHTHTATYETLQTAGGFRDQPLVLTVTTAGSDKSYIWRDEYKYARAVVTGTVNDESFFGISYELDESDDPMDPSNWEKANPNLGPGCLKVDFLEARAKEAMESPVKMNQFTRYHANRQVTSTEAAFNKDEWMACKGELSDWREADAIGGGVDLGSRDDLAAFALVARFRTDEGTRDDPVYRYECKAWAYISKDCRRDLTIPPFSHWIKDGTLAHREYPINDLLEDLVEQCGTYPVDSVAYDPHNAQPFAESLEQHGIEAASMSQTTAHFNEPIQELRQLMAQKRITHDGNYLLGWCVCNANAVIDRQDRWFLSKRDSSEKIDAAVALVMALRRCMLAAKRSEGPLVVY